MGMTIEDIEQWARQNNYTIVADNWWEAAQDRINKYQQLQADYENRLKADIVAMLDKLRAEIKKWYWQADKQALAKDPCVVDAMIDLFIRTIDKYKAGTEPQESEDT